MRIIEICDKHNCSKYTEHYGEHFNEKLCHFACEQLPRCDYTKERLDALLKQYNVELKNNHLHDYVYVANWCRAILFGSSIQDEKQLVVTIRDILDKESDLIFNRWCSDMCTRNIDIDWDSRI